MVSSSNYNYLGPLKLCFLVLVALSGCSPICGKQHLFLRNEIRNNVTLSIYCQDRGHDLGPHILDYKQQVEWILSSWKAHRVWCSASWKDNGVLIQGGFHVIDELVKACTRICIRYAKSDGVYGYNEQGLPYMIYRWPLRLGKALEEEIKV